MSKMPGVPPTQPGAVATACTGFAPYAQAFAWKEAPYGYVFVPPAEHAANHWLFVVGLSAAPPPILPQSRFPAHLQ